MRRSGRASVATSQSFASRPSRSSRSEPPPSWAAWPLAHSVARTGLTWSGTRGAGGIAPRSTVSEEEVAPPGLVARVGQVRREERVDVAARLLRRPQQPHARLLREAAALAVVAGLAGGHEVVPGVAGGAGGGGGGGGGPGGRPGAGGVGGGGG